MTTISRRQPGRYPAEPERPGRTRVGSFVEAHPILAYFGLTFAISWTGVLVVAGRSGFPATRDRFEQLLPLAVVAMIAGPSVASILLTYLIHGREGLRELRSRLLRWRSGLRWYAAALLTAPILTTVVLLALSARSGEFVPGILIAKDRTSVLLIGLAVGLGAGVFEELGWTGFATPELRRRHGALTTGLGLGAVWGAWHLLPTFWGSGDSSGALSAGLFIPSVASALGVLPAYRVLMVRVYDRTGSLLVGMLMHLSLTTCTLVLQPQVTGLPLVSSTLGLAVVLWVVVATTGGTNRPMSPQPLGGAVG